MATRLAQPFASYAFISSSDPAAISMTAERIAAQYAATTRAMSHFAATVTDLAPGTQIDAAMHRLRLRLAYGAGLSNKPIIPPVQEIKFAVCKALTTYLRKLAHQPYVGPDIAQLIHANPLLFRTQNGNSPLGNPPRNISTLIDDTGNSDNAVSVIHAFADQIDAHAAEAITAIGSHQSVASAVLSMGRTHLNADTTSDTHWSNVEKSLLCAGLEHFTQHEAMLIVLIDGETKPWYPEIPSRVGRGRPGVGWRTSGRCCGRQTRTTSLVTATSEGPGWAKAEASAW